MSKPELRTYFAMALDPIHVGGGTQRLGRVDLAIAREPSTNLPKLPGTGLAGVARYGTALANDKLACAGKNDDTASASTQCGKADCPVCVSYGFGIGNENRSLHGMAQFFDAQIVFFPVYSMVGTVWVTSEAALKAWKSNSPSLFVDPKTCRVVKDFPDLPKVEGKEHLNLGWLFLPVADRSLDGAGLSFVEPLPDGLKPILKRLAVAPEDLFARIVGAGLERRTSVSIDPMTGAAADGALFTYEAIPRGTVFAFQVVYNDPAHFQISGKAIEGKPVTWVKDHVHKGLRLMKDLGVGGMNTRGMGRLEVFV